eukprot:s739_g30.t1
MKLHSELTSLHPPTVPPDMVTTSSHGTHWLIVLWVFRDRLLAISIPDRRTKLESLTLSIAHGDYLYSAVYQVPFRIVRDTLPANPLDSLLTVNMHGDKDVGFAENPALSFRHFRWLSRFTRFLSLVWFVVQFLIIGPFTIGPLFRRLLMEVPLHGAAHRGVVLKPMQDF